jgi:hypothetical protein
MAEFKAGDRVVKMSGMCAGKYGTVNSVMENGTLNITFDGGRLPKYCDPEKCGAVARNAVALPSDAIRSESDLARTFAKKGWKLITEGNRWTLRDDKGVVRWQDSFGGDAESYDRVFRRFASYLNLR